jgi:hypothetical protein
MDELDPISEIHAIRDKISEETMDMSPEEYSEYWERKSRNFEAFLLSIGYKYVPVEGEPNCMRIVQI